MTKSILEKSDAINALKSMKSFHDELRDVMSRHDFDIFENLGRRNILLSQAQEKFFAEELGKKYQGVEDNGRTGEPDIMIGELDKELECKLTSPQKKGNISFQTDHQTLSKKGKLDYLYVVADRDFKKFAVIYYHDLTIDDYRKPSSGSRGKVQLLKHKAHPKAEVLLGEMKSINESELLKLNRKLLEATTKKKKEKIEKSIKYWTQTPTKYSIILESLDEVKCR